MSEEDRILKLKAQAYDLAQHMQLVQQQLLAIQREIVKLEKEKNAPNRVEGLQSGSVAERKSRRNP